jgi:hypothetical protein
MVETNSVLSKLMALLLLAAVLASACLVFDMVYVRQYLENDRKIQDLQKLLFAYEARQEDQGTLEAQLQRLRQSVGSNDHYITQRKLSVAIAQTQELLKKTIRAKKGALRSSQIIPSPSDEPFKRLTIRTNLEGTPESIRSILYSLETQKPYLMVSNLKIQPASTSQPKGKPEEQILKIEMDISGYLAEKTGEQ